MPSIFSFGKKRRSATKKRSKKVSKSSRKLPSKVVKMCKKLKIKTTTKRGGKRVLKSTKVLLKQIKKKLKMLKKKRMSRFGASCSNYAPAGGSAFGRRLRKKRMSRRRRNMMEMDFDEAGMSAFGKKKRSSRRRKVSGKVSKSAAMKAFKRFYTLHCKPSLRRSRFGENKYVPGMGLPAFGRRSRFGGMHMMPNGMPMKDSDMMFGRRSRFGAEYKVPMPLPEFGRRRRRTRRVRFGAGNPPLMQSMGFEFCPEGGGVVESNGLFPTPCNATGVTASAEMQAYGDKMLAISNSQMKNPNMTVASAFGRRRMFGRRRF